MDDRYLEERSSLGRFDDEFTGLLKNRFACKEYFTSEVAQVTLTSTFGL